MTAMRPPYGRRVTAARPLCARGVPARWPRHTADFTLLRAYVGPDGAAAEPSEANVPYRPERYLRANPAGTTPDDFVFLLGFPGSTMRCVPCCPAVLLPCCPAALLGFPGSTMRCVPCCPAALLPCSASRARRCGAPCATAAWPPRGRLVAAS